jgi:c-di-GMP-binding flagellar brake protein YcgR
MNYARYFKTGQKVFLINISPDRRADLFESLSGVIAECGEHHFHLTFPYLSSSSGVFSFREGMYFKVTSETFGVGVQLSARYEGARADGSCRFSPTGDLELFQRRQIPRIDLALSLSAEQRPGSPAELQEEWDRRMSAGREGGVETSHLVRCAVNLSAGGIRFETVGTVAVADLHLVDIDIEDGEAPLCAVAETVWVRQEGDATVCGNRFIRILKRDQDRLVRLIVDRLGSQGKSLASFSSNWELLDRMIFSDL